MRLTDLEPRWLSDDFFIFKNPTGGDDWLSCKRVVMPFKEQYALVYNAHPDMVGKTVVFTNPVCAWQFEGNDFSTLTVHPSIDASASRNWHGFITNGEIK